MKTAIEPRKSPRQTRSQATVDAILDATARVLVERGHAATNTNLVAERAGVSVGSLYQYFPNKLALINALHARHSREMTLALEREFKPRDGEGLHATLARVIEAVMHAHQVDADLHRAFEQCEDLGLIDDAHDEAHAKMQSVVRELLTAHRREITAGNLDLAAFAVMHTVHALVHGTLRSRPAGVSVKASTREIVRLAYAYLTAPA